MHHFVTEMRTRVHISVTKWCIVRYVSNALWDLLDGSIMILGIAFSPDKMYQCLYIWEYRIVVNWLLFDQIDL